MFSQDNMDSNSIFSPGVHDIVSFVTTLLLYVEVIKFGLSRNKYRAGEKF